MFGYTTAGPALGGGCDGVCSRAVICGWLGGVAGVHASSPSAFWSALLLMARPVGALRLTGAVPDGVAAGAALQHRNAAAGVAGAGHKRALRHRHLHAADDDVVVAAQPAQPDAPVVLWADRRPSGSYV